MDGDSGSEPPLPETEATTAKCPAISRDAQAQQHGIKGKQKRKTLFSFYKKVSTEGEGGDVLVDQNSQLDVTLAAAPDVLQDEAPPAPKIQRLNSDGSVLRTRKSKLEMSILRHYELDVPSNPRFQNLTSVADLYRRLVKTKKIDDYHLIDRLIRLVLILPVSTTTTERVFSAMKLVKTRLQNKMEDGFLRNCLVLYIEKEIAIKITTDSIINNFNAVKEHAVKFKD